MLPTGENLQAGKASGWETAGIVRDKFLYTGNREVHRC